MASPAFVSAVQSALGWRIPHLGKHRCHPPKASFDGYELVWAEEFNRDVLDQGKWTCRTDSKHLSTQKSENVSARDGFLYLALKKGRRVKEFHWRWDHQSWGIQVWLL
ncbi:MAG TPA: hypothetical protein VL863_08545 [bacterium]|nr:hypothetical protein [bacterium]